jgi:hypothetical protein
VNPSACPYEEAVARAARSGLWNAALREHAAGCGICRETALVAGWLKAAVPLDGDDGPCPDPELIWLRSRSMEKESAIEKTLLPVRAVEAIGGFAALATAFAGLIFRGPDLIRGLPGAIASGRNAAAALFTGIEGASAVGAALAWPAIVLLIALWILVFITYPALSED